MADVHNPTGLSMSEDARRRLLRSAREADVLVVDDAALSDLWLSHAPTAPPLAAMAVAAGDPARVITIGSISKTVWSGLRVGWIRADESLVALLTRLKAVSDVASSVPSQVIATAAVRTIDERLVPQREEILRRRDRFAHGLKARLPEWDFVVPPAGLALWVRIPSDASAFAAEAARHGVGVLSGSLCVAAGGGTDHLRIGFAVPPEAADEAIRRLAVAWAAHRHDAPQTNRYRANV
jgi:DNA-binding transcriptional MocR family regulator